MIDNLTRMLEEKDRKIAEMSMVNDSLERRLKMYENAHVSPSHNSAPAQQKKKRPADTTAFKKDHHTRTVLLHLCIAP